MGTRADFYVGRGEGAEWLGSIAFDGYPKGIAAEILNASTETEYRERVARFLVREDGTTPEMGWPWSWEDSRTTNYAYAFDFGRVWAHGASWFVATEPKPEPDEEDDAVFPNMKARQNVTFGRRSGLLVRHG